MRKETILSIVLAIGVVTAGLWVADDSLRGRPHLQYVDQEKKGGYADSKVQNKSGAENAKSDIAAASKNPANAQELTTEGGISKCIINGKTSYSNQGCPEGVQGQAVAIHKSQGIVSPPKETLAELTAMRQAAEQAQSVQRQERIALVGASNGAECADLDKRIAHLDAMARQPQSGQMQDWIKEHRKAVRDRQFAIHC